jgi:hypothetical protein
MKDEKSICKLIVENVPCSIDTDILTLFFESEDFCGQDNEIVSVIEKENSIQNDQNETMQSRSILIEYKNGLCLNLFKKIL